MKLIWTYSKDFKRGVLNNTASHGYIQWLFKESIKTAPSSYEKIMYTDEETVHLFVDIVDKVIVREKKEFIFLADLKFDIAEKTDGEFIVTDGDIFIDQILNIPPNVDMAFEFKGTAEPVVQKYKSILLKEGIGKRVAIWETENNEFWNLGLMYFNNDAYKNKLINEYRKTQNFYIENIEPVYKFIEKNKQFSACASQMLIQQFNLNTGCKIGDFSTSMYRHYGNKSKMELYKTYNFKLI